MFNPKLDSWEVSESDFPDRGSAADKWRFLLQYAVLAPSVRNVQPWAFREQGEVLELYVDRSRELPAMDPRGRELVISCGAVLFTLRVALERFECGVKVSLFPRLGDDELLARLEFQPGKQPPRELRELFPAIQSRHTQRMPFESRDLPEDLVRKLREDAHAEGVNLRTVDSDDGRKAVAKLVSVGDREQAASPTFRLQLAQLFRANISPRRDGMPGYTHGMGWLRSLLMPWLIQKGDWGEDVAVDDFMSVMYAPALVVFSTPEDNPEAWLATGQALMRVLLRACNGGVSASFLGQAIEVPTLREKLREALGKSGHPQLMLRMGYGAEAEATPRRPVRAVLNKLRF